MPTSYRIFADARFVHSVASGVLVGRELQAHAAALAADPAFSPSHAQLVDMRAVTAFDATAAEMRQLAQDNPFARTAVRVGLAGSNVAFGMLRMYQLLTDAEDTGSLVTRDETEAWSRLARTPDVLRGAPTSMWRSEDDAA